MKNTLYFILLVAIFLSSNLFAIEQPEENINQEDVSKSNTDAEKTSPLLGELKESTDPTNVINEEVPSSNQTNLQSEEETNIKDTEFSISPLLEEKKKNLKRRKSVTIIKQTYSLKRRLAKKTPNYFQQANSQRKRKKNSLTI